MRRRANRRAGRKAQGGGGPNGWQRYQMTQKLVAIGDDYYVEDESGERAFVVDGKALRLRDTLKMRDLRTDDKYRIQERIVRVRNTMTVSKNGKRAAMVKKAIITPIRGRFTVQIPGNPDLRVQGNILDHEYRFTRGGDRVAEVSKRWFRVRDTYGIGVAPEMDAGLAVATSVALDMMTRPGR